MRWWPALFLVYLAIRPTRLVYAFVRAVRRRRLVRSFIDAPAVAPTAYVAAMIESATADHGYAWRTAGVDAEVATRHGTLLRSPDGTTLAMILDDSLPKRRTQYTMLCSEFANGSALLTSDLARLSDLDRGTRVQLLVNADFSELRRLHDAATAERGDAIVFPIDCGWADVAALAARKLARVSGIGRARFLDADHATYRLTWRGAFITTIWFAITGRFDPPPIDRRYKRRPGADGFATATPIAVAAPREETT